MMVEHRERDEGYSNRRAFDTKTLVVLLTAMFGSSGITGLINWTTDPNVQMERDITGNSIDIQNLRSNQDKTLMRVENYIKSHNEEEILREKMIEKEFEHIRALLEEIKDELKETNKR